MTIKDVEERTGLSRSNIRFYEKEKLIEPSRNEYGESRKKPAENKQTAKAVCYLSRYSYSTVYLLTRDVATPLLHCTGISVGNLE